jgi:hypothetical protein
MRNEGEHFRTGVQELDKFPQGAEGFDAPPRRAKSPSGAPVRSCVCASQGGRIAQDRTRKALARQLHFYCARIARAAWLKPCPDTEAVGSAAVELTRSGKACGIQRYFRNRTLVACRSEFVTTDAARGV